MDELANDLSYAMIDVDRIGSQEDFLARLAPSTAKDPRRGIPSASKDGECSVNCNSVSSNDNVKKKSTSGCKSKSSKPVLRSASILLRSKKLILSDSESEDTEKQEGASSANDDLRNVPRLFGDFNTLSRKHRVKRHRRRKEAKEERTFGQLFLSQSNFPQYSGKRKRSSNTQNHSNSICSDDNNLPPSGICHDDSKLTGCDHYQMDFDSPSCDSSSLSESNCDSDHFAEADDEQSDFYEFISRSSKGLSKPLADCKPLSRTKYSPSIPIPSNPFASIPPTPSSSYNSLSGASSSILWKRRRRNH